MHLFDKYSYEDAGLPIFFLLVFKYSSEPGSCKIFLPVLKGLGGLYDCWEIFYNIVVSLPCSIRCLEATVVNKTELN